MAEGISMEDGDCACDGGGGAREERRGERLAELEALVHQNHAQLFDLEASIQSLRAELGEHYQRHEIQAATMLEEQLAQSDTLQLLMRANEQRDRQAVGLSVRLEAVEQCLTEAMQAEPRDPSTGVGALAARLRAAEELATLRERLRQLETDLAIPSAASKSLPNRSFGSPDSCEKGARIPGRLQAESLESDSNESCISPCSKEAEDPLQKASPWSGSTADHSGRSSEGLGIGSREERSGGFDEDSPGERSPESLDPMEVRNWLAQLAEKMEAGLRVDVSSRLDALAAELREQLLSEARKVAEEPKVVRHVTSTWTAETSNASSVAVADSSSRRLSIPAYLPPRRTASPSSADRSTTASAQSGANPLQTWPAESPPSGRSPSVPHQLPVAKRMITGEEVALRAASRMGVPPPLAPAPSLSRGGAHSSSKRSLSMSPNVAPKSPTAEHRRVVRVPTPARRPGEPAPGDWEAALAALKSRMQGVEKTAFSMQLPVQAGEESARPVMRCTSIQIAPPRSADNTARATSGHTPVVATVEGSKAQIRGSHALAAARPDVQVSAPSMFRW